MLHTPEDGRPSLGLDLAEEFRQPIADRVVLSLANNRVLSPVRDFKDHGPTDGFRLTDEARGKFFLAYENRMTEPFRPRPGASSTSMRECLRLQAHQLARAMITGEYRPFSMR